MKSFIKNTINEFKKIEWPTRKELIVLSSMVAVVSVAISLYTGMFDFILVSLLKRIHIL